MKTTFVLFAALALLGAINSTANAATYLVNGSFETGDYTGWVRSGYGDGIVTGERVVTSAVEGGETYTPESGNYFVEEGPVGSDGYLSQTFTDTPGTLLTVSGWVIGNGIGTASNDFVDFIFDGTTYVAVDPVPEQPWTQYSFNVIATGTDTFSLAFRDDPSGDGLDNFSITNTPSVTPLPAALPLFATGLGAMGLFGWLRKRRNAVSLAA